MVLNNIEILICGFDILQYLILIHLEVGQSLKGTVLLSQAS